MQRLINIYHTNRKVLLDNYENLDISDIHNILNYSADFIRFNDLELFEYNICEQILSILINKLTIGGSFMLCLYNIKNISRLYSSSVLPDQDFLHKIRDLKSIWSSDLLDSAVIKKYKEIEISKIQNDNQNHSVYITLTRKSI